MADSAADPKLEAQKRRSTRISQAVPITVKGIDALGRSFEERTSTLAISCHGCRYQSKHYVLKNTWLTLDVPHSEANHEPRSVRARVTWIQRPRTVRELFQIAAELEAPGNIWGIAFPQPDWVAFPEPHESAITPHAGEPHPSSRPAPHSPSPHPPVETIRILSVGAPSTEASASITQQVAGLIEQAKMDLQTAVRENAAQAAAMETGPLIAALQKQLEQAAEHSVQTVAEAAAKRAVQESLSTTAQKTQEYLKNLQQHWNEELEAGIQQAGATLRQRLSESGEGQHAALRQEIEAFIAQAHSAMQQAFAAGEAGLAQSREGLSAFRQQADVVAAAALEDVDQRLRARAQETQTNWHTRLHSDLSAATELWDQRIESSLESAAQKSAERLARNSQATADRLENELGSRISSLGKVFAEATAEAEARLNALRASVQGETARAQGALAQVQFAASGIDEHAAKFDAVTRNAQQELQRRAATVMEAQSRELARRAEDVLAGCVHKLTPSLEAAAQQAVARLAPQIDQELVTHLKPAQQAYARLERGVAAMDETLSRQQETITRAANQSVETARGRLQETVDRISREIEEGGRASSTKCLAEIDAKAAETMHATFESLFKTADWYEKKAQVQLQGALEKGLEQADVGLREKAGEISRLFASELDHYNRSYVDHAHSQLEEAAHDVFERAHSRTSELLVESVASLEQQAKAQIEAALAGVHEQTGAALSQFSAQASSQIAQARIDIAEAGGRLSADFRDALNSDRQDALTATRHDFALLAASSVAELRNEGRLQQAQLAQSLATSNDHSINEYKKRLESTSNSWLLTTVSRLDQQSQQLIQSIAQSAQEQVREACADAFAQFSESLRQHSVDQPSQPQTRSAAASSST